MAESTRRGDDREPAWTGRILPGGICLLLLIFLAGAFLPGARTWGLNSLAYLPRIVLAAWALGAGLLILLLFRRPSGREPRWAAISSRLLESRFGPLALSVAGGIVFLLLRSRSFFMGDGHLLAQLASMGVPFHGYDDMHYALVAWVYRHGLHWRAMSPEAPFQAASVLGGMAGVYLIARILGRLSWEPWRKLLALGWLLGTGPVALYFGYVEVYSFLLAFLSAFLLAGLLALEGRCSLWWPGLLLAGALFFSPTAVFSAPAILVLLLRRPISEWKRRWAPLILPSCVPVALWAAIHLVWVLDAAWFRRGFLETEHARTLFMPLTGPHGLLSGAHWRDMLNLALLTAPVPLATVLLRLPSLKARVMEPAVQFVLVQAAVLALSNAFVGRELGVARDWDLLAAHIPGLVLLAVLLWPRDDGERKSAPPGTLVVLLASLLLTAPWVLLLHRDGDSTRWMTGMALDSTDPTQPLAYEELGKYYRDRGDYARAEDAYRRCVQTGPDNPRYRVLLGTTYAVRGKVEEAKKEYEIARGQYEAALRANPNDLPAKRRLAQILAWQGEAARAADLFQDLTRDEPKDAALWVELGRQSLSAGRLEAAAQALSRAAVLSPHLPVYHDLGVAWMGLGRSSDAADAFRRALKQEHDPADCLGLGAALVSLSQARLHAGGSPDPAALKEAEDQCRILLRSDPRDQDASELLRRTQLLRQGIDPETAPGP